MNPEINKKRQPQMNADERRLNEITEKIIGLAYKVANSLGHGFLEKIYENALVVELTQEGLQVSQQHPISVFYNGQNIGDYFADLLVENEIVVEIKASRAVDDRHFAQCLNYLKATGLKICLLINFGKQKVETRRVVNNL
jgi:GxxExxY protein